MTLGIVLSHDGHDYLVELWLLASDPLLESKV